MGKYEFITPITKTSTGGDATYSLWKEPASPWCSETGDASPWLEIDMIILYHVLNIDLLEGSSEINISLTYNVNNKSMEKYIDPLTNDTVQ